MLIFRDTTGCLALARDLTGKSTRDAHHPEAWKAAAVCDFATHGPASSITRTGTYIKPNGKLTYEQLADDVCIAARSGKDEKDGACLTQE